MSRPVDTSRERIERLHKMGSADYIHMALLDERDALQAALDAERERCAQIADRYDREGLKWAKARGIVCEITDSARIAADIRKGLSA